MLIPRRVFPPDSIELARAQSRMRSSITSPITLVKVSCVTNALAGRSSTILAMQGYTLHEIKPHYQWKQNHGAEGDEGGDASIHS